MKSTTIALRDADSLAGGRAELTIDAPEFTPARISVTIRRGTETNAFLGPKGWQQSEHHFAAESFAEAGGKLVVILGPAVVNNTLRTDDIVEMTFPEVGMVGQVVWSGITRSIELTEVPKTPESDETTSGPVISGSDTIVSGAGENELPAPDTKAGGENGAGKTPGTPVVDPGPRFLHPVVLALVAVLAVAAAGAWYYLPGREHTPGPEAAVAPSVSEPTPSEEPEADSTADANPPPAQEPTPPPTPAPSPTQPAAPDPVPVPADPAASHAAGLAALAAGDCAAAGAAFAPALAAGYGPTLLAFARAQSSVDFKPCLFETPNDVRALGNFEKACKAGEGEAKASLQTLLDTMKKRADEGDPVASDVLRVYGPKATAACGG